MFPASLSTQKPKICLKAENALLIDLDGTLYLDGTPLPGAVDLIRCLLEKQLPFRLVTNNSSKSGADYLASLKQMGFPVEPSHILTSGMATIEWLKIQGYRKIHLLGTQSLAEEFTSAGLDLSLKEAEILVLAFDRELNYQKLCEAHQMLQKGLPYIATHPDLVCPTKEGSIPDCGSFIELLHASSGRRPDFVIGKPNRPMAETAARQMQRRLENLFMLGDRLYTDIRMGHDLGFSTVLFLSGEAKVEDLHDSLIQPDFIFKNAYEFLSDLQWENK